MTAGPQTEPPLTSNVRIGNDAGWLLTFQHGDHRGHDQCHPAQILSCRGRQQLVRYYADIHAGLPSGLEGGGHPS